MHVVADRAVMTLETALARVSALLGERIDWSEIASFLPDADVQLRRSALASSFVATLELARQGKVELRQTEPFAPLYLRRCG
jgi:segregation and condensation protein A